MTGLQIENRKKQINDIIMLHPTKKTESMLANEYVELACREMINSCLIYDSMINFWGTDSQKDPGYASQYTKKLGYKRVSELVNEQIIDFNQAKIIKDADTDSEGISYSKILWKDEQ